MDEDNDEPTSQGIETSSTRDERPPRTLDYLNIDLSVFQGLLPVAVFLIVNQFGATQAAIGASFLVSAIIFVRNRARGVIRFLSVLGFSIVTVSAVIGIVSESDRVFAAQNIVADVIFATIFLASVLAGRPLIGAIARDLVPGIRPVMELNNPVFVRLTLLSAAINVVSAVARGFMIVNLSVNTYVIVSRVVFLPVNIAFIALCYVMVTRTAIRIWPVDMPSEHLRRRGGTRTPSP